MIFPKRLVIAASALAWAPVGSTQSAGWKPTKPPNSLPVSTPVSGRLRNRVAFSTISLSSSLKRSSVGFAAILGGIKPLFFAPPAQGCRRRSQHLVGLGRVAAFAQVLRRFIWWSLPRSCPGMNRASTIAMNRSGIDTTRLPGSSIHAMPSRS
jgi:hypothetical protein